MDLCVCDTEGKALATTFPDAEDHEVTIMAFVDSPADSQVIHGYQFFKIFDEHQLEYILLARGSGDDVYMVGKVVVFQIQRTFWLPIRNGLTKITLLKICCWIICCW